MALIPGEQSSGGEVRDGDGRLIVVGPGGVAIAGGGGGSAADPLSDGTPGGALPSKTLWVAGADGAVLRGITVNASGHQLVAVQNFPATQAVSDGGGSLTVDGTVTANAGTGPWPVTDNGSTLSIDDGAGSLTVDGSVAVSNFPATQPVSLATNTPDVTDRDARVLGRTKIHDGTNVASVLNAAPGSDTGQSAVAVRVVSQLGAGSGGGGSAGTIDAPADNVSPTLAQHVQAFLSCFDGTNWDRVRGDTTNGIDVDVTRVQGTVATTVSNFPGTQPVSGTVTANAGTGPFPVSDNGGSLTVDAPAGTPLRVDPTGTTVQPVSLAAVPTVTEKQDQPASTTTTWTSATAVNTALTNTTVAGYGTANVSIQTPSTATAGALTIEVSDDGTTWYPAGAVRVDNSLAENVVQVAGPGIAQSRMYAVSVDAMTHIRVRVSTVIVGTGNTVVRVGLVAGGIEPLVAVLPTRTISTFRAVQVAATVADTLMSTVATRGLTAAAGATSQTVTAGKTLRIESITVGFINSTAAVNQGTLFLRARASGTLVVGDPALWHMRASGLTALQYGGMVYSASFPNGIDLPSGTVFGLSSSSLATTGFWDVAITGYEF